MYWVRVGKIQRARIKVEHERDQKKLLREFKGGKDSINIEKTNSEFREEKASDEDLKNKRFIDQQRSFQQKEQYK